MVGYRLLQKSYGKSREMCCVASGANSVVPQCQIKFVLVSGNFQNTIAFAESIHEIAFFQTNYNANQ